MQKSLDDIRSEVAAINADAIALCGGLSEEQLGRRPQPGKWSIAENIAHLNVTTQAYLPGIRRTLHTAQQNNVTGKGPYDFGLIGKWFVNYLEPPFKVRTKAPKMIQPILQGPASEALPQFLRCNELLLTIVDSAEGVDLGKVTFVSPFSSLLRMKLIAAFATITAHDRRHLWIIRQFRDGVKA